MFQFPSANNPASPRRSAVRPVSHRLVVLPLAGSRALEKLTAFLLRGKLEPSASSRFPVQSASNSQRASSQDGDPESAIRRGIEKCPQCRTQDPCHAWKSHMPMLMGHWAHTRVRHPFNGHLSAPHSIYEPALREIASQCHCSRRYWAAGRRGGQAMPFAEDSKQKMPRAGSPSA